MLLTVLTYIPHGIRHKTIEASRAEFLRPREKTKRLKLSSKRDMFGSSFETPPDKPTLRN